MEKRLGEKLPITNTILAVVGVAGVISLAAVAPGVIGILGPLMKQKRRYRTPRYLEGRIGVLQKRGLVRVWHDQGERRVKLTEKGERALAQYQLEENKKVPKKWDGKWRLVIFDIHEYKRGVRDRFRETIMRYGFLRLQNSVWVYPYDCEDLVIFLKADNRLGTELLYIVSEKVENDGWLKQKFGL